MQLFPRGFINKIITLAEVWLTLLCKRPFQIVESAQMRQLIIDKYDHICGIVLKIAHNNVCARNPHIQKASGPELALI